MKRSELYIGQHVYYKVEGFGHHGWVAMVDHVFDHSTTTFRAKSGWHVIRQGATPVRTLKNIVAAGSPPDRLEEAQATLPKLETVSSKAISYAANFPLRPEPKRVTKASRALDAKITAKLVEDVISSITEKTLQEEIHNGVLNSLRETQREVHDFLKGLGLVCDRGSMYPPFSENSWEEYWKPLYEMCGFTEQQFNKERRNPGPVPSINIRMDSMIEFVMPAIKDKLIKDLLGG